ncbi:hypothetical protein Fmac_022934 [Flemingia macrophylla]|uniref:Uncharacterized protein n=1 Tax=Flemingia macrophylla TaxID=520843 RepID=A0ABD1LK31_9FABA
MLESFPMSAGTIDEKENASEPTKAPVLRLDAQGREIDEHGNVVNVSKPSNLSTLKVNSNKQKKHAFEILKPVLDVDPEANPHFDERICINKMKLLRPKRMNFQFVEEGKWSRDAETIKLNSKFGAAQAKENKAKQAQLAKAKAAPGEAKLKMEKITFYVEHPLPIEPPAKPAPPPPQPPKLTKQEQKKLRTQRRIAKEKDSTQDPTRLGKEIRSAAAEREQAHIDRNIAHKLTPAEQREKKERKLFDGPNTPETLVSLYRVNDLSYPKARFRVDDAQEKRLTACAVISDGISVVVVEGGKKEENEDSDVDKPANKCVLVWQGSFAKPNFNRFSVHDCIVAAAAACKVFVDASVPYYWDLAVNYVEDEAV